MTEVTTYNLLPSVRAPIEGETITRLDMSIVKIGNPVVFLFPEQIWQVQCRPDIGPVYVAANRDPAGVWLEVQHT